MILADLTIDLELIVQLREYDLRVASQYQAHQKRHCLLHKNFYY